MNRPAQGFGQCLGKLGFDSWEAAWRSIRSRRRNGGRKTEGGATRMKPHRCDLCPKWHIGGGSPVQKRRKRSKRMGVAE